MRRSLKFVAALLTLTVVALGIWWSWAQLGDDSVLHAKYQQVTDGMTLAEVRNILGKESLIEILVDACCRVHWQGNNKSVIVRIPKGSVTVQGRELVNDNSMVRNMRWMGGQVNDLYCKLTSTDSSATPVVMEVP